MTIPSMDRAMKKEKIINMKDSITMEYEQMEL